MDRNDRDAIDGLFARLRQAEERSPPRDGEAEALIRQHIARQPAAPYYMAQVVLVQEQALAAAQARIEELERQPAGGFLGSLFGGGAPQRPARPAPASHGGSGHAGAGYGRGPWGGGGGGFLAGAAQTALAIGGGLLLGNMLTDWLTPDEAMAAPVDDTAGGDAGDLDAGGDFDAGDAGGFDMGGDF